MHVPCIKGYNLHAFDFIAGKKTPVKAVDIYNNICDCGDLCQDASCPFYNLSERGDILFHDGMVRARATAEGIMEDRRNEEAFLKKYKLEKVEKDYTDVLRVLYKHKPDFYCIRILKTIMQSIIYLTNRLTGILRS